MLDPRWNTWIFDNLTRGSAPGHLVAQMERAGIAAAEAQAAVRDALTGKRPNVVTQASTPAAARPDCWPAHYPFRQRSEATFEGQRLRQLVRLEDPAIALIEGVLSADECEALIAAARPQMKRAEIIDAVTGEYRPDPVRTSDSAVVDTTQFPLLPRIEARLAWLMACEPSHLETLQILRYRVGGEFRPHMDAFDKPSAEGGQRTATLVIYLADVELGGTTVFPEQGLGVAPSRGMGVYFAYGDAAGRMDPRLLHAGAPLLSGEKWVATQWIRDRPFRLG
ncbi:MAG TPA: 2OG-Fe(II) oxygenase [Stenotrophomonas sp.]|nr:2OG-Fe(II) oxygenase [Stenotrophomonas sp.]